MTVLEMENNPNGNGFIPLHIVSFFQAMSNITFIVMGLTLFIYIVFIYSSCPRKRVGCDMKIKTFIYI